MSMKGRRRSLGGSDPERAVIAGKDCRFDGNIERVGPFRGVCDSEACMASAKRICQDLPYFAFLALSR